MDIYAEALQKFNALLIKAKISSLAEPNAMTLATVGKSGQPSVRTVLLKEVTEEGFVFYTNLTSRKSHQLTENPQAALCFFWPTIDHQVTIEGKVQKVSEEEADDYWKTRPRESQWGAWASQQSSPLDRHDTLLAQFRHMEKKYSQADVPRPPHWSGYRVVPERIEIWKRGDHRLHHRTLYEKTSQGWTVKLLYP